MRREMALIHVLGGFFVLLIAGAVAVYVVRLYNRLVRVDRRCENAWSDVEVVLKQRRDALEKLTDTVREAMDYEERVLTEVVEAREAARAAESPGEQAAADEKIRSALARLRAEDHPSLSATDNLSDLHSEIATLEEQIADRREYYNEAVTSYNTLIRQFPYVVFAGAMGYSSRELFDASEGETADVDVGDALGAETGAPASG